MFKGRKYVTNQGPQGLQLSGYAKRSEIVELLDLYLAEFIGYDAIDCSGSPNYPAADAGQQWIVSVAGLIGGGAGTAVEVGDVIVCITDTIGGTHAVVGAFYVIVQKNMKPLTAANLRALPNDNADFATSYTFSLAGLDFDAATILGLSGGTTSQLGLTTSAAQIGLQIGQTASTSRAIDIVSNINDATTRIISVATAMSAAFTTDKELNGYYFTHTSNGTDVTGAVVNGASVYLSSTALSKISFNGYKVDLAGTYTAAAGSQTIAGFSLVPTITLSSATTTLYGVNISLADVTRTNAVAIYGGRFVTATTATSAILASNSTNTVDICNTTNAINISGTSTNAILIGGTVTTGISIGACATGINFTGAISNIAIKIGGTVTTGISIGLCTTGINFTELITGNAIDFNAGVSVTGSLIDYIGINGKTSGYLFNGSMITSVLDATTIVDDFGCSCAHDGLAADVLRGTRRIWSGAMPNGVAAPNFILEELQWNSVFGSGAAIGGTPQIVKISSTATINDSAANFTALNLDMSAMTLTSTGTVYGLNITTMVGFTAAINTNGYISNTMNAGTLVAATVTAVEYGDGKHHVTVLTLTNFIIGPLASAAASKVLIPITALYTFPAGAHILEASYANVGLTCDGTAVTPDVGLGSVAGDGSAFATLNLATIGITVEDTLTGYAIADTNTHALVASGPITPTAGALAGIALNNASSAKTIYLNAAAAWNANNTSNLTATGTVIIVWDTLV